MAQVIVCMQEESIATGTQFTGSIVFEEKKAIFALISAVHMDYIPLPSSPDRGIEYVASLFTLFTNPILLEMSMAEAWRMVLAPIALVFWNHPKTKLYHQFLKEAVRSAKAPVQLPCCPLIQQTMMTSSLELNIEVEVTDELAACLF